MTLKKPSLKTVAIAVIAAIIIAIIVINYLLWIGDTVHVDYHK